LTWNRTIYERRTYGFEVVGETRVVRLETVRAVKAELVGVEIRIGLRLIFQRPQVRAAPIKRARVRRVLEPYLPLRELVRGRHLVLAGSCRQPPSGNKGKAQNRIDLKCPRAAVREWLDRVDGRPSVLMLSHRVLSRAAQ
jgi:hypothetical protein